MSNNIKKFNDTPIHALFNIVNSKDRKKTTEVLQGTYEVFKGLWEQNIIKESEQSREELNGNIFDKLTEIEKIKELSELSIYLKQRQVEYQNVLVDKKNKFKQVAQEQNEEEIVNDIIGG